MWCATKSTFSLHLGSSGARGAEAADHDAGCELHRVDRGPLHPSPASLRVPVLDLARTHLLGLRHTQHVLPQVRLSHA